MGPSKPVTPSAGLSLLWFVALAASALAFSTLDILARDAWTAWRNGRTADSLGLQNLASTPAPHKPSLAPIATYPASRVRADRRTPGLLYAGTSRSDDGGRSWRPLTAEPERLVALGGSRGLAPLPGPGMLLLAETLVFTDDPRRGRVAHASIWRENTLEVILPEEPAEAVAPRWRVRGLGFTPSGAWLVLTEDELIQEGLGRRTLPGTPRAFLAARDGSLYLAVADESRFPLYRARDFASPWLPIAGASAVGGFFESESGEILAAGRKLGRSAGADWRFSDWIAGADAEEIAADATGRRILAWGQGRIYLSGDAGETFHACPTGDVVAASAFFPDARRPDAVVLDRRGRGYRLDESLCR